MRTNKQIIFRILIVIGGFLLLMAVFLYFYIFDPTQSNTFFMRCTIKESTGLDCVGCGAQRTVYSLLHGNILEALSYNALFVLMIPLLVVYISFALRRFIFGIAEPNLWIYKNKFGIFLICIVLCFLLIRNIPIEPFLWLNSSY